MHPLEQKIKAANEAGRMAVIPFITAGFPSLSSFWHHLGDIDAAGADIIEIGIPFSDPVADGPVVEDASRRSLLAGISLADILADLRVRKGKYRAELVLMGYYNPFLQYGLEKLAEEAREAGVSGFIIPDLPFEEASRARNLFKKQKIALVPLVGPNTGLQRMRLYAQDAEGYAYVVSVMGITGERKNLAPAVTETMLRAREAFTVPLALGFGLSKPQQLAGLPKEALPDAAVMGSALLKHIDAGGNAADFLECWFK